MHQELVRNSTFISFDGAVELSAGHQRPDRYRHLEMDFGNRPRIARGGGYSYSAASFGEKSLVQEMVEFDRFLEFDAARKTVKVEAGMRLGKLMGWAMQRRLYFPVLPGYPDITIGGCIAVDAHGKNPWKDGSFADWVTEANLFHPSHRYLRLSRADNAELFALTCGGFGTTGIIVDATLQLIDLPSNAFEVRTIPVATLTDALRTLEEHRDRAEFVYSWHDGLRRGKGFGTGVVFSGNWRAGNQAGIDIRSKNKPMTARSRADLPFSLWNRYSATVANRLFMAMNRSSSARIMGVDQATFPFAHNTLYHRFYGSKGFAEVQLLVQPRIAESFVRRLQDLVGTCDPPLVMISLKMFRGKQTSLSMAGDGYLIALDFFRNGRLAPFLEKLDRLAIESGAQPNLSKDSRIPAAVASRTLPDYAGFKSRLLRFDPLRMYRSELTDRIGV